MTVRVQCVHCLEWIDSSLTKCPCNGTGKHPNPKWYLPVGLYPENLDALSKLRSDLLHLGMEGDSNAMSHLRDIIAYFSDPNNDAYLTRNK